jgi:hypothetical protein
MKFVEDTIHPDEVSDIKHAEERVLNVKHLGELDSDSDVEMASPEKETAEKPEDDSDSDVF